MREPGLWLPNPRELKGVILDAPGICARRCSMRRAACMTSAIHCRSQRHAAAAALMCSKPLPSIGQWNVETSCFQDDQVVVLSSIRTLPWRFCCLRGACRGEQYAFLSPAGSPRVEASSKALGPPIQSVLTCPECCREAAEAAVEWPYTSSWVMQCHALAAAGPGSRACRQVIDC